MDISPDVRSQVEKLIAFRKLKRNVSIFALIVGVVSFAFFTGDRPGGSTAIIGGLFAMGAGLLAGLVSLPLFSAFQGLPPFWFLVPPKK
jgi:membrane associated rhomboid family serine protease